MASPSIALPVPKELAINTNHPNASSVVIDLAAQRQGTPRRSLRQIKPVGSGVVKNKDNTNALEQTQRPITLATRPKKTQRRFYELASRNVKTRRIATNYNYDIVDQPSNIMKSRSPESESESIPSSLTSAASHSSSKPNQRELLSPSAERSYVLPASLPNSSDDKGRNSNGNDKVATKTNTVDQSTDLVSSPNLDAPHTATSSSVRHATRNTVPRKTPKRLALEAHMLSHDAYGTVRYYTGDPIAPYNAEEHLEKIKATFENEDLMQRIEVMHDDRMRQQDSQHRLWILGQRIPWVLRQFDLYEEYEEWMKSELRREVQRASQEGELEGEDYTGQTTDEEFAEKDGVFTNSRIAEMDAAEILLQMHASEKSSGASARAQKDLRPEI